MYNEYCEKRNFCLVGKKPAFIIKCDCCANLSVVSDEHKRYCPVCGPDVIAPITVAPYSEDDKTVFKALNSDFAKQLASLTDNKASYKLMADYCFHCDYPHDCSEDYALERAAKIDPSHYEGKDCEECAIRRLYSEKYDKGEWK